MNSQTFFVEYKGERGQLEPLGVMTMENALEWAWQHEHVTLEVSPVNDLHKAETH